MPAPAVDDPPAPVHERDNVPLAALYMVSGTALFVVLVSCFKAASHEASAMQAVLYRSVVTALVLGAVMAGRGIAPVSPRWPLLALRGVVGTCALFCYFWAGSRIRLADLQALQQLAPLFTAFLAFFLLGERPRASHWGLAGVCLVGALLIVRPTRGLVSLQSSVAVLSAAFSAGAYVTVRALTRTEPANRIVFWFALVGAALSLPFALPGWQPLSLRSHGFLLAAGLLAAPGQSLMTAAYRHAPAHIAAVFSYATVPLGYLAGLVIWGERPDALAHVGIGLVLLAGAVLVGTMRRRSGGDTA